MRALLLGGTGFIGRELLLALANRHHVMHVSRTPLGDLAGTFTCAPLDFAADDAPRRLLSLLRDFDPHVIIHAAGPPGETRCQADVLAAHACHVGAVQTLLDWQLGCGDARRVIYLSSMLTSGLYGTLKQIGEIYVTSDSRNCALRLGSVYGDAHNDGIVPKFIRGVVRQEGIVIIGSGHQTLPLVHVDDVVSNVLALVGNVAAPRVQQVYERVVTVSELYHHVSRLDGRTGTTVTHEFGDSPRYELPPDIQNARCQVSLEEGLLRAIRVERAAAEASSIRT